MSELMVHGSQKVAMTESGWADNSLPNGNGQNVTNLTLVTLLEAATEQTKCYAFEFYLYSIAMGVLCILGLVGNSMSFYVLQKDHGTPVATFLLQILAIADNAFLLLWMIHYSIKSYFRYFAVVDRDHNWWLYTRVYTFPLLYMTQTETIWLTVVIALNRYMAVCLPYKAPRFCTIINVYKEVAVVTIFSLLYNLPRFFEIEIKHVMVNGTVSMTFDRTSLGRSKVYATVYTDALYYLFSFVLPLLILAFVNTRVTIAYQAIRKRKRRMTSRRCDNENNITLVMIMVVLIFISCQAPARIVQLVWSYKYNHCHEYQYYLIHISNTLEVLNSSVNFLIYFVFRKRFRDIIAEQFCCGPAVYQRRDSARATTTEGLSLAQFEQTASNEARCNSIKEADVILVTNHTSDIQQEDVNKNQMTMDEDFNEPLNGIYRPPCNNVNDAQEMCEQQDGATIPLTI